MIKNGTRPVNKIPKKKFHHVFGGVDVSTVPDFNVDAGLWNPSQDADGAHTECTGYSVADFATDIFKKKFSPDYSYALALYLEGVGATTNGADAHIALQGLVAVGALPQESAQYTALDKGELFVSNYNIWKGVQEGIARGYFQNGTMNVLGNGDAYSSIVSATYVGKIPVSCATPWFREWQGLVPGSVLPMPSDIKAQALDAFTPWHDWNAKGKQTIGVGKEPMIPVKSWQGFWVYMPREVANAVFSVEGTGAMTINPNAIRWVSQVAILIERFPNLAPFLPQLLNAKK